MPYHQPPAGPVAAIGPRIGARAIDLLLTSIVAGVVLATVHLEDRPWSKVALAAACLFAYEFCSVAATGTTLGKRAVGLHVVPLDSVTRPTTAQAARRAGTVAGLGALVIVGWIVGVVQVLGDPLRRSTADRSAGTMVVPVATRLPIRARDLPGYADGARAPRLTTLGRVADADVRARARLRRLTDLPALAALVGLLALLVSVTHTPLAVDLGLLGVWIVAFAVDETRRIHRDAGTSGHQLAGIVVLSTKTGQPPTTARSAVRAIVLGLQLYVPPLWLFLGISALLMRFSDTGRGLHDLVARTVVVADPRLDPEAQRQRAMAVRLGRVT